MSNTNEFCTHRELRPGDHPGYTKLEFIDAGDWSIILINGNPWCGDDGEPIRFDPEYAAKLAAFWNHAAAQWSQGVELAELARLRERLGGAIRDGRIMDGRRAVATTILRHILDTP